MPGQVAKRLRDGPVTIPRGVLVDQRGPGTGMPEPGHQLLETRAASATSSPQRRLVKVASRTRTRNRTGIVVAISNITGSEIVCRPGDSSLPPASIRQGVASDELVIGGGREDGMK